MLVKLVAGVLAILLWATCAAGSASGSTEEETPSLVCDQALQSELESLVAQMEGTYGIVAEKLEDGRFVSINGDRPFPAASMYKLLVMYRVFQQLDAGEVSPDQSITLSDADAEAALSDGDFSSGDTLTVAEALEAMITVSSNTVAHALTRSVGGWNSVASVPGEVGMDSTLLIDEDFWSTPSDLLHFFARLADGSLISQDASEQMIDLLLRQKVNNRIPSQLPAGTPVAHKTGELDDVRNDGGIVEGPGGRYLIVMMSQGSPDEAVDLEAAISRMVYDRFGAETLDTLDHGPTQKLDDSA